MSSSYSGTAVFPPSITIPSDGDPRLAASVAAGMSSLRDGEVWLKGQTDFAPLKPLAANFNRFIPLYQVLAGVYSTTTRFTWFASLSGVGLPQLTATPDPGASGSLIADVLSTGSVSSGGELPTGIDVDASGNPVVATRSRYIFQYNVSAGTASKVDVIGAAVTTGSDVCFDPNTGRFVLVGYGSGAVAFNAYYSTNRTTWTTVNIGATAGAVLTRIVAKKTSSTMLAFRAGSANGNVTVSRTTDAGTTWTTALATIATGFTSFSGPVSVTASDTLEASYSPITNTWYLTIGKTAGGGSEVWTSTNDGASWTRQCLLTSSTLSRIAVVGSTVSSIMLSTADVFSGTSAVSVFSVDGGATWQFSDVGWKGAGIQKSLGCRAGGQNNSFSMVLIFGSDTAVCGAYFSPLVGLSTTSLT